MLGLRASNPSVSGVTHARIARVSRVAKDMHRCSKRRDKFAAPR